MEYYEIARIIASLATAIGVAIAAWQIWRNSELARTSFEDSLSREYRDLIREVPYKVLVGQSIDPDETDQSREIIYNYYDFCNQQIYLRHKKRIRRETWLEWREGIKTNMAIPLFSEVADQIFTALPDNFKELQRLKKEEFTIDPAIWK